MLVTGGAGFIGSHVAEAYAAAGHNVVVVDDLSSGNRQNLPPEIPIRQVDIRSANLDEVFAAEQPEVVNHHAAQISVNFSVRQPRTDADVNIAGSLNVIDCCVRHGVKKMIYISSGGAAVGEPRYLPVDEQHPVDPLSPYGVSKHTVEHYLYLYRQISGLDYTILRYPNVYGPRQDPLGEAGVVAIFLGQMLRGEPTRVNGSGDQLRDYIHVSDLARANVLALGAAPGTMYNTGTGVGTSVNEIWRNLAEILGYRQSPVHGSALPGEVYKIYLDSSRVERDLGWRSQMALADGLRQTAEWFKAKLGL
ncbi:MAG: NAD-dependent epimerase/dehydratase family protein [Chloroflexota bacterium]